MDFRAKFCLPTAKILAAHCQKDKLVYRGAAGWREGSGNSIFAPNSCSVTLGPWPLVLPTRCQTACCYALKPQPTLSPV